MKCNNKHCYWNFSDSCCHEDEEKFAQAKPDAIDCPSSLRADFESQFYTLFEECQHLLRFRNFKELIEIKKFIQTQRPEGTK